MINVSARNPYGIDSNADEVEAGILCHFKRKRMGYVDPATVKDPRNDISKYKVRETDFYFLK